MRRQGDKQCRSAEQLPNTISMSPIAGASETHQESQGSFLTQYKSIRRKGLEKTWKPGRWEKESIFSIWKGSQSYKKATGQK